MIDLSNSAYSWLKLSLGIPIFIVPVHALSIPVDPSIDRTMFPDMLVSNPPSAEIAFTMVRGSPEYSKSRYDALS